MTPFSDIFVQMRIFLLRNSAQGPKLKQNWIILVLTFSKNSKQNMHCFIKSKDSISDWSTLVYN